MGFFALFPPLLLAEVVFIAMIFGMFARRGFGSRWRTDEFRSFWDRDSYGSRDTAKDEGPTGTDRVFDRFRKGSTSTGSGLGLTISRDLVEAHGGTIAMSSTPGRGTAVVVTLPVVEVSG